MANIQKRKEKRVESWKRIENKNARIKENNTFFGRARIKNAIASEMFDSAEIDMDNLFGKDMI